jgi:hypothetical protein
MTLHKHYYSFAFYLLFLIHYTLANSNYKGITEGDIRPWSLALRGIRSLKIKPKVVLTCLISQDREDALQQLTTKDFSFSPLKRSQIEWTLSNNAPVWSATITVKEPKLNPDNDMAAFMSRSNDKWSQVRPAEKFTDPKDLEKRWKELTNRKDLEKIPLERIIVKVEGPDEPNLDVVSLPCLSAYKDSKTFYSLYAQYFEFSMHNSFVHLYPLDAPNHMLPLQHAVYANLRRQVHSMLVLTRCHKGFQLPARLDTLFGPTTAPVTLVSSPKAGMTLIEENKLFQKHPNFEVVYAKFPHLFGWGNIADMVRKLHLRSSVDALPKQLEELQAASDAFKNDQSHSKFRTVLSDVLYKVETHIKNQMGLSLAVTPELGIISPTLRQEMHQMSHALRLTSPVYKMLHDCESSIKTSHFAIDNDEEDAEQDADFVQKKPSVFKSLIKKVKSLSAKPKGKKRPPNMDSDEEAEYSDEDDDDDDQEEGFVYCPLPVLHRYESYKKKLEELMSTCVHTGCYYQDFTLAYSSLIRQVSESWEGIVKTSVEPVMRQTELVLNNILQKVLSTKAPAPSAPENPSFNHFFLRNILHKMMEATKKSMANQLYRYLDILIEVESHSMALDKDPSFHFMQEAYAASVLNFLERDVELAGLVYNKTVDESSRISLEDVTSISHFPAIIRKETKTTEADRAKTSSLEVPTSFRSRVSSLGRSSRGRGERNQEDFERDLQSSTFSTVRSSMRRSRYQSQSRKSQVTAFTRFEHSTEILVSVATFLHMSVSRFADNISTLVNNVVLNQLATIFSDQKWEEDICQGISQTAQCQQNVFSAQMQDIDHILNVGNQLYDIMRKTSHHTEL